MAATVTNGDIDTAAAAIDAPYGPFTRVTSVADLPVPNSNIRLQLTTALGDTVFMTYEQLQYEALAIKKAKAAASGFTASTQAWKSAIDAANTVLQTYTAPDTYAQYKTSFRALRAALPELRGNLP